MPPHVFYPIMKKITFQYCPGAIAVLCMLSSSLVMAEAEVPNAGTLQQQINPQLPAQPSKQDIDLPATDEPGVQDDTPFTVSSITIEGNVSIDSTTLHELVKDYEGSSHTITDLQQACRRITSYYRAQGYPLARAILPQQEIDNGAVRIQVIEARYGSINLNNQSSVDTALLREFVKPLHNGDVITQGALDKSLLLLSDVPGVKTASGIKPGQLPGQTDLDINLEQGARLNGRVAVDDFGNKFIRRQRYGAGLNLNNLLHHGDVLGINVLSTGDRMHYGQISYDWLLNGQGSRLGASYASMHYRLGEDLKALDVNGSSEVAEVWLKHPMLRSRSYNLYATVKYQYNELKDRTGSTNLAKDRHLDNWLLTLNGDWRDGWLGGGVNSYLLTYTSGQVNYDDRVTALSDAATADTQGHYAKWNYNLNRLQAITGSMQLWLSVSGQVAQDNLDSSQKMVSGGPYSVRAFDSGAVSGDNGQLYTVELRKGLGYWYGNWQVSAFFDAAQIEVNHQRWAAATGLNKAHLSGVGVGINWQGPHLIQGRLYAATSTGSNNTLTQDADHSVGWFEVAKYF